MYYIVNPNVATEDPLVLNTLTVERSATYTDDMLVGTYPVYQQAEVTVDGVRRVDLDPTPHKLLDITIVPCVVAVQSIAPVTAAPGFTTTSEWPIDVTITEDNLKTYVVTETCDKVITL